MLPSKRNRNGKISYYRYITSFVGHKVKRIKLLILSAFLYLKRRKVYNLFSFFFLCSSFLIFSYFFNTKLLSGSTSVEGTIQISVCGNGVKEPLEQCDTLDTNQKTCSVLGFDDGTLSCLLSCQFSTSLCSTTAHSNSEDIFTNELGGSLQLNNADGTQISIEIPTGAYINDLSLYAFSRNSNDVSLNLPAPLNKEFVGRVYDLRFFDENGTRIDILMNFLTITISYLNSDLDGLEESEIEIYHYNEEDSIWYLIPDSFLSEVDNSISLSTVLSGFFALFSIELEIPSDQPQPRLGGSGSFRRFIPFLPKYDQMTGEILLQFVYFKDGKVDITDLSILLYWWGKTGSEIEPYDLNKDGKIDIVDASILFYYWTE